VFFFLDVQLTLSDLVFVRVPLPRCSTDAFNYLFPFLFFRSRARRLNAGEPRLFEVDKKKVLQFSTLIETNSFEIDTQAKVLGISTGRITKAWKFFEYRKLSSCTTRFLHSGEHGFNEDIMKQLGFKKEDHVTVLVWYALLDDKTKKKVNTPAARVKRNDEKAKQEMVENEKGEKMTKAQFQREKRKQEMVDIGEGRMVTKAQFQREKEKQIIVENEKGEKMTKAQLRNQVQYEKRKQEMVDIGEGRMVTKAQLPYEKAKQEMVDIGEGRMVTKAQLRDQVQREKRKQEMVENEKGEKMTKEQLRNQRRREKRKQEMVENEKGEKMTKEQLRNQLQHEKRKQRNKEFVRKQFICRPPGRLQKEKCSICGREKSFGWAKAPDALWYVEKLFKEKGLTEYPSFRAANGYLTMKKRKYLGKEDILLRTTDILCYACWKTCEGAAEKTMQKLLKL
jgi:hypothetical protein